MILRVNLFIICTVFITSIAYAIPYNLPTTTDELPEWDEKTSQALVENMGKWLNMQSEDPNHPQFSDEHYKQSFLEMSGAINFKLTKQIKAQILYRTNKIRSATERTLGLTEMYFPIFEEYLSKKGMPRAIKYLTIVESNLNPVAKSHASAVGLWQFIPGTGRMYGLKVASYADERSDTHKATDAATTMLSNLYKRYGDWCLALAAYNCGPGRIDRLVKSKGYNYWVVRKYLPRETQNYVPFFMAVAYTYEYHALHELKAQRVEQDLILTDTLHLAAGYKSLSSLATKYGVTRDMVKRLNPVYIKNYIPSSMKNPILVLPARIVAQERGLMDQYNRLISINTENPIKCVRRIHTLQDINFLMQAHQCTLEDILFWNRLPKNYKLQAGDIIAIRKYYAPKDAKYNVAKTREEIASIRIHSLKVIGIDHQKEEAVTSTVYAKAAPSKAAANNLKIVAPKAMGTTPKPSTRTAPASKTPTLMERVSRDRSRTRRIRGKQTQRVIGSTTSTPTQKSKVSVPAVRATVSAPTAPKTAKKNNTTTTTKVIAGVEQHSQQLAREERIKLVTKQQMQATTDCLKDIRNRVDQIDADNKAKKEVKLPSRTRARNIRN
jgi:membrane-bound lytic murein transglycosylase D